MAFRNIANNPNWEYNDNPPNPGVTSGEYPLWLKQTAGIRTNPNGQTVYTDVRKVGYNAVGSNGTMGELSKTYWDAQGNEIPEDTGVLKAQRSVVVGTTTIGRVASGTLEAQVSTVNGVASFTTTITGSGTLEAQVSTVDGDTEITQSGSGILLAQVSTVSGAAGTKPAITGTGILQAQVSKTLGIGVPLVLGTGILQAQVSTVVGASSRTIVIEPPEGRASTDLQAQNSTVAGIAVNKHVASGALTVKTATVVGVSENMQVGSGSLQAQVSTVVGAATTTPAIIASGSLQAQVVTVVGAAGVTPAITGTGTLEAQVSKVAGIGRPLVLGTGILAADPSVVAGVAEGFEPYVYMEEGGVYDFMEGGEKYVIGEPT